MHWTTHFLLCCKPYTLEDVRLVSFIHSEEDTLTLTSRVVEEHLHQGKPILLGDLVLFR